MKREETTLLQLKQDVDKLLTDRPYLADATVLIDTEARTFNAHMIDVTSIYAEDDRGFEGMGRKWVTITPDYKGTTHLLNENELEFDEARLSPLQLELLDREISDAIEDLITKQSDDESEYVISQLKEIIKKM